MASTKLTRGNNEEGFTLIELIIVVVIIGILSAIAIPIFINQQKQAHTVGLKSDLRHVAIMTAGYGASKLDVAEQERGWAVIKSAGEDVAFPITTTLWYPDTLAPDDFPDFQLTEGNTIGITYTPHLDRFCVVGYNFNSDNSPVDMPSDTNRWKVALYYDPLDGHTVAWNNINPAGGCGHYIAIGNNAYHPDDYPGE